MSRGRVGQGLRAGLSFWWPGGGKEERNVVKIQGGAEKGRWEREGVKRSASERGEERVKRKVGRNTHSLFPLSGEVK